MVHRGNRTMAGYQTGSGNQLTSDGTWTYSYDNEGNLIKKTKGSNAETWYYSYNEWNELTSVKQEATDGGTLLTQVTYVYDALGNRIEEDVWTQSSGTTTVTRFGYDGQAVWADLNGSNQLVTRYLRGDQRPKQGRSLTWDRGRTEYSFQKHILLGTRSTRSKKEAKLPADDNAQRVGVVWRSQ